MNEQECAVALQEIQRLGQRCGNERQLVAWGDLATMLDQCGATPGSHLWFAGD
ncbi:MULTISPECIES: hypothetical protein [Streptomyces]|uniref:hypothetical protein n=1 Tax=Streptomyces TaxID=1883 RepID=UPI000A5E7948|nr:MULTISPECIES: hypothetical protein [Streptomyces]